MNEWNASQWDATVFRQLHRHWALLTAGSIAHYNAMTINWGGFGTLWQKPTVTVYVKPVRYTHDYMMEQEYFSVSFFPERYHQDLVYLGTTSGRQTDKLSQTSLTPGSTGRHRLRWCAGRSTACQWLHRESRRKLPHNIIKPMPHTPSSLARF